MALKLASSQLIKIALLLVTTFCAYGIVQILQYTNGAQLNETALILPNHMALNTDKFSNVDTITTHPSFHPKNWSVLYFQHVRKAGGTSVRALIRNNGFCLNHGCKVGRLIGVTHLWSFDALKLAVKKHRDNAIIREWGPFFTFSYLEFYNTDLWKDVLLIFVLRDPIHRVWSDILYSGGWSCYSHNKIAKKYHDENFILQCIEDFKYQFLSNIYTKILSGIWMSGNREKNMIANNISFNKENNVTNIHYDLAKNILNEFDIVIILEQWDQQKVQLLCHNIVNVTLSNRNVGLKRQTGKELFDLNNEKWKNVKQKLYDLNEFDIKLYQFAKVIANEKTKQCKQLYDYEQSKGSFKALSTLF